MIGLVALLKTNCKPKFQQSYLDNFFVAKQHPGMAKKVTPRRRRIFLREWRRYRKLTQEQLAERVGWGVSNVSQLETGRQGYSDEGLERLAKALKCHPGQLLSVDPTKDGDIWPIWESATPADRQKIVDIAKTIIGKPETH